MKMLILSRRPQGDPVGRPRYYSTARLIAVGRRMGHSVSAVNPMECALDAERVYWRKKELKGFDVVIPRIGNIAIEYSLAIVRHFRLMGIPIINPPEAIHLAKDKFASLQVLKNSGLPVPRTALLRSGQLLGPVVKRLGGLPVILKLLRGSQGIGVILAKRMGKVRDFARSAWSVDHDVVIQEFIPESGGCDIRILVVGGAVAAAMRRYARRGDFRSNIHQGGFAEEVKLTARYRRLALRAARALGLQIAGVDIIESRRGPLIIEVNASPGFEGMEKVTGRDIARQIIKYAVSRAKPAGL